MVYGSVCSGIEAASVAWKPLGWKPAWFSEIESFPKAVLAHHYPDVPDLDDMTKITETEVFSERPIELLVGETPCQSFSLAGLRKGLDDPRGNLALEFLKIVDRARPRWVVWENVPGVLSSWTDATDARRQGSGCWQNNDFDTFIGALAELGYGCFWRVLDAQYFGLAQRRKRVFVVGYLGDWRPAAAVLLERQSMSGNPAPRREKGQTAPTLPSRSSGGGGLGTDCEIDGGLIAGTLNGNGKAAGSATQQDAESGMLVYGGNNTQGSIDVAPACNAKGGSGRMDFATEPLIAHTLRSEHDASEDGTGRGTPLVPTVFMAGQGSKAGSVAASEKVAPTLRSQDSGLNRSPSVATSSAVRRLTPRECERLQGFPDDYTAIKYRNKRAADGPRYKAIGNSMAVSVMRWIGERIQAVEEIKRKAK